MANEVQIFENSDFGSVRTVIIDKEPYFVGKDVCETFDDKNHNRSLGRIDEEDKRREQITDSLGRKQEAILINESGLYALLFSMQPQKANHDGASNAYPIEVRERIEKLRRFKRWVTHEVLPSIRKTGSYSVSSQLPNFSSPAEAARAWADEYEKRCIAQNEVKYLTNKIEEQTPKVNYYDIVLKSKDAVLVSVIAQDYGMTAKAFNSLLYENGIQHKLDNTWVLYAKYVGNGYTKSETYSYTKPSGESGTKVHTKWTQKGRLFLYEFLKNIGVLPNIEK